MDFPDIGAIVKIEIISCAADVPKMTGRGFLTIDRYRVIRVVVKAQIAHFAPPTGRNGSESDETQSDSWRRNVIFSDDPGIIRIADLPLR